MNNFNYINYLDVFIFSLNLEHLFTLYLFDFYGTSAIYARDTTKPFQ